MEKVLDVEKNKTQNISQTRIGTRGAHQRFLTNVVSNLGLVFTQTIANLWLTPFLITHLGIAGFGIIPLVNSIVNYMSIVTTSLNSAIARFLAIDLDEGNHPAANKTFNSALFAVVALIFLMIPVAITVSIFFPTLFNVVDGWEADASWLVLIISVSFFLAVFGGVFALSTFVHSQFLLSNLVSFLGLLTKIGAIFILFSFFTNHLWFVGVGVLLSALLTLFGSIWLWRKLTPELHIDIGGFDVSRLKALGDMGWWTLVTTFGTMFLSDGGLIIANILLGATIAGGYASVLQLSLLLNYLIQAADIAIRPVILIKYAQKDFIGLKLFTSQAIKLLGWALALPVGLLCGFARPFLSLWLGSSYTYLDVLLIIIVFHLSINFCVRPLLRVQTAYNKVRWPGIVTASTGIVFAVLAVIFSKMTSWGVVGIALASTISWSARNSIYLPIYTARIMKLKWWAFFPDLITSIAGTLFVGIASYLVTKFYTPNGWISLGISAVLVSLIYAALVWFTGMSRAERQLVIGLIPDRLLKSGG